MFLFCTASGNVCSVDIRCFHRFESGARLAVWHRALFVGFPDRYLSRKYAFAP